MDCDVAIKDFSNFPYVIERPATPDLLADAATDLLSKSGLRIEFGAASKVCNEHDRIVRANLPKGVGFIPRRGSPDVGYGVLISGVPRMARYLTAAQPSLSACADTWTMLGHVARGTDLASARKLATDLALRNGAATGPIGLASRYAVDASAAADWNAAISSSTLSFEKERSTTPIPSGTNLGESYAPPSLPDTSADFGNQKFDVHSFEMRKQGPSWLPTHKFNSASLKIVQGIHPDLLEVVALASSISRTPFQVVPLTGGMRSASEQRSLKAAGHSKAVIGRHTLGLAIDLVPVDHRGRPNFGDFAGFSEISRAMKEASERLHIAIEWGGNWKRLVDRPHFELNRRVYLAPGEKARPDEVLTAFR